MATASSRVALWMARRTPALQNAAGKRVRPWCCSVRTVTTRRTGRRSRPPPVPALFSTSTIPPPVTHFNERNEHCNKMVLDSAYEFAEMDITPITLQDLLRYGNQPDALQQQSVITAAVFLHREIPIRLAHRITELDALPYGLNTAEGVEKVKQWYLQSFSDLVTCPLPDSAEREEEFAQRLRHILARHAPTLVTISSSLAELHAEFADPATGLVPEELENTVSPFLDRFYSSRIGVRTLLHQHLAIRQPHADGWSGVIQTCMSPRAVAESAINDARVICERTLGDAPDVRIIAPDGLTFPYIPSYFHHMMFELLKNSFRAVMEHHGTAGEIPPVRVIISGGGDSEDVVIKVSDEGGGIPRSAIHRVWKYLYTTAKPALGQITAQTADFATDGPLAGLGYGLPLSRNYARYWGGELQIISMEGYGTDAYLHLRLDGEAKESVSSAGAGFWRAAASAFSRSQHPSTAHMRQRSR